MVAGVDGHADEGAVGLNHRLTLSVDPRLPTGEPGLGHHHQRRLRALGADTPAPGSGAGRLHGGGRPGVGRDRLVDGGEGSRPITAQRAAHHQVPGLVDRVAGDQAWHPVGSAAGARQQEGVLLARRPGDRVEGERVEAVLVGADRLAPGDL